MLAGKNKTIKPLANILPPLKARKREIHLLGKIIKLGDLNK